MDALLVDIVPTGRWEDFETYWSCSKWGIKDWVGKKIPRNNMYKQCNFSIFWTAEALLETYKHTNNKEYLNWGQRTLDELLTHQAVWQPQSQVQKSWTLLPYLNEPLNQWMYTMNQHQKSYHQIPLLCHKKVL